MQSAQGTAARKSYGVSPTQFIHAWETSLSVDEVSKKLGMPVSIVQDRLSKYKKAGVQLKDMPRRMPKTKKVDVEAMNELIRKIRANTKSLERAS